MANNKWILRGAAIVILIMFFLPFFTVSAFGIAESAIGFSVIFGGLGAFNFFLFLALLTAIGTIVFLFLPKDILPFMGNEKFAMCLNIGTVLFLLLGNWTAGAEVSMVTSFGAGGWGVGWWLALIIGILLAIWYFFGGKIMGAVNSGVSSNGSAAPSTKFCTKCGAPIEGGSSFCTKCGAPVEDNTQNPAGQN